jgi:transcriptional regulator with XRE-family HTH domain
MQLRNSKQLFLNKEDTFKDAAETIGGRIIHAREAQDLSTAQLARRLGVKSSTLHAWETDQRTPRSNRLIMLAGVLNVSPTWLLMGYGERPTDALTETEMEQMRSVAERLRQQALTLADDLGQLEARLEAYESYQK